MERGFMKTWPVSTIKKEGVLLKEGMIPSLGSSLGGVILSLQLYFSQHALQEETNLCLCLLMIILPSASLAESKQTEHLFFLC